MGRGVSRSSFTASIAALLVRRLAVGEGRLEPRQPLVREVEGDALARLPLRVELDQVAGELAHRLAGARADRLPRLAAELRERGRRAVGADVAGDLAELLVRDVEAVLAAEREQEVVARHARDRLRLEAEQLPDAVILVHDVVAAAEVGERLESPPAEAALAGRAAAEDLMIGKEDEAELAPDEAPACGRDGEEKLRLLRQLVARLEEPRLDAAEQVLRPQRLAPVREGDDDALPGADAARASSLSASASPRAAIAGRCASKASGCACGNGSSSVAPARDGGLARPSSSQTRRTASGSNTRSGGPSSGGTRSSGTSATASPSSESSSSGSTRSARRSAAG